MNGIDKKLEDAIVAANKRLELMKNDMVIIELRIRRLEDGLTDIDDEHLYYDTELSLREIAESIRVLTGSIRAIEFPSENDLPF